MTLVNMMIGGKRLSATEVLLVTAFPEMPTACDQYVGRAYMYAGVTDATYVRGHFYLCERDGSEGSYTYVWTDVTDELNQEGLTAGGGSGQFLRKQSGVNYDCEWKTIDSSVVLLSTDGSKSIDDALELLLPKADVVNNLMTTAAGRALDARQGKKLADEKQEKITANGIVKGNGQGGTSAAVAGTDYAAAASKNTVIFLSMGWVGDEAPYTQDVSLTGMTTEKSPIVDVVTTGAATGTAVDALVNAYDSIDRIVAGDGKLTATCLWLKPTIDVPVQVIDLGV